MIILGTCVGDEERYRSVALPSLERIAGSEDLIWSKSGQHGIVAAYNEMIRDARALPRCEALVLLHEDVEIIEENFRAKLRRSLREGVGVVGVIGASGLDGLAWWNSPQHAGMVYETRHVIDFGGRHRDVDAVDGLLMALAPAAFSSWAPRRVSSCRWRPTPGTRCTASRPACGRQPRPENSASTSPTAFFRTGAAKYADFFVDCVVMWHVLEHVAEPRRLLHEVADVLKPNGSLIVELPNFASSQARIDGSGWEFSCLDDHLFHYTPDGLARLLDAAGFETAEILPFSTRIYDSAAGGSSDGTRRCSKEHRGRRWTCFASSLESQARAENLHAASTGG